jgi:hypothetical protein
LPSSIQSRLSFILLLVVDFGLHRSLPCVGVKFELSIVLSILKVASKYFVTGIQLRCLDYLDSLFPMTLSGWHKKHHADDIESISRALVLVDCLRLDWILPTICCRILVQIGRVVRPLEGECALYYAPPELLDCLPSSLQVKVLAGATTFMAGSRFIWDGVRNELEAGCENSECAFSASALVADWAGKTKMDPFAFGYNDDTWDEVHDQLYLPCGRRIRECWEGKRGLLWDMLPVAFGMESWDELKARRTSWREACSTS